MHLDCWIQPYYPSFGPHDYDNLVAITKKQQQHVTMSVVHKQKPFAFSKREGKKLYLLDCHF